MSASAKKIQTVSAYRDNPLIDALGPIFDPLMLLANLTDMPELPINVAQTPFHIRLHQLYSLRNLYVPSNDSKAVGTSMDLMIRQGYSYKRPGNPETWGPIFGDRESHHQRTPPAMSMSVIGTSGTGKTEAIGRNLSLYPSQVYIHEKFPQMASELPQLIFLRADVPESGRSEDLAVNLMRAFDQALDTKRFAKRIEGKRRDGPAMMDEWRDVANAHFLGVLHLDEVQNFFKIATLKQRRSIASKENRPELRVIEDGMLKSVLSMTNTWRIPLIFSGTPDGMAALSTRLSTAQRLVTCGHHVMHPIKSSEDVFFKEIFFPILCKYQWVVKPMKCTSEFASLIIELSGGIMRIVIMLWIAAHRVAFDAGRDELRESDFHLAADSYLSPLKPAVEALRSDEPLKLARYEDLLPRSDPFWAGLTAGII